jgi:hypothetical protein
MRKDKVVAPNIKSAAVWMNLPLKLVRIMNSMNADGIQPNCKVNTVKLMKWYTEHKEQVDSSKELTLEDLKVEDKEKDIRIKELKIREMERDLLLPEDVKQMLVEIATAQSVMIKKLMNEWPIRLAGKSEQDIKIILDKEIMVFFDILENKIIK